MKFAVKQSIVLKSDVLEKEQYILHGEDIMREEISISKKEYMEVLKALEKAVYILDRCEAREDADNNAYSLAIMCAKSGLINDMLKARGAMCKAVTQAELDEMEEMGVFDLDVENMKIPYEDSLEDLRKQLKPYLPEVKKLR